MNAPAEKEEWEDKLDEFWRFKKSTHTLISLPMWKRYIGELLTSQRERDYAEIEKALQADSTKARDEYETSDSSRIVYLSTALTIIRSVMKK